MQQYSFTLMQTLHLLALVPCLFAVLLLMLLKKRDMIILVPALFFAALAASFALGLEELLFVPRSVMHVSLVWVESLLPALCFLLIIQLWRDQLPAFYYWLILALPIVGGSLFVQHCSWMRHACQMVTALTRKIFAHSISFLPAALLFYCSWCIWDGCQ